MMEIVVADEPYASVTGHDGIVHVLWRCSVDDSNFFQAAFEHIGCTYIADGHHRAASAFNVGKIRREKAAQEGQAISGEEPFNFFMAIHYPESNLRIMDYNRVLRTLNELTPEQFLERVGESYVVHGPLDEELPRPAKKGECTMFLGGRWYRLQVKEETLDKSNLIKMLDSQLLTDLVLSPVLGISDLRSDDRIDFVGGIRGLEELVKRCKEDCVAAFAMYPV